MLFREENKYMEIGRRIIDEGYRDTSRTGIGISKTHVETMSFDISDGKAPIISTRQLPNVMSPINEMKWFASGSTDIGFLKKHKIGIWDSWVIPETAVWDNEIDTGLRELEARGVIKFGEGMLGKNKRAEFMLKYGDGVVHQLLHDLTGVKPPERKLLDGSIGAGAYGAQWRHWEDIRLIPYDDTVQFNKLVGLGYTDKTPDMFAGAILAENPTIRIMFKEIDQLQEAIDRIKTKPDDRRIIVCPWNAGKLDLAQLPPCHSFFQFLPFEKNGEKYLDLSLTCRSQDFLVGTVFNVYQYSVLCHAVAKMTDRKTNRMFWIGNNTHIYDNQKELFNEYHRDRAPLPNNIKVHMPEVKTIQDFIDANITVEGYESYHEPISYPVAV